MKNFITFAILILTFSSVHSYFIIDWDSDDQSGSLPQNIATYQTLKRAAETSNDPIEIEKFKVLSADLYKVDSVFSIFNRKYKIPKEPETPSNIDFDCYKYMINTYKTECFDMNEFDLPYMKYFAYSCQNNKKEDMSEFLNGICNIARK